MKNRPNYYELLELDPVEQDSTKIRLAIDEKQKQWSRETNHPRSKKRLDAKRGLELIGDIRRVMSDVQLRESEANRHRSAMEGPFLDSVVVATIQETLEFIGKATLYEFLDLPSNASLSKLNMRTREMDAELRRIAVKDANFAARGELIGFCLSLFKSDEHRAKYDNSLAQQASK